MQNQHSILFAVLCSYLSERDLAKRRGNSAPFPCNKHMFGECSRAQLRVETHAAGEGSVVQSGSAGGFNDGAGAGHVGESFQS